MTEPAESIPLSRLTTLQVGAAPARMVEARTRDELVAALREVWADGEAWIEEGPGAGVGRG